MGTGASRDARPGPQTGVVVRVTCARNYTHTMINFTVYDVVLQFRGFQWMVQKRWSEMVQLHKEVQQILSLPQHRVARPPRTWRRSTANVVVTARIGQMQDYLTRVLNIPDVWRQTATRFFCELSPTSFIRYLGRKGKEGYLSKRSGGYFNMSNAAITNWRRRYVVCRDSYVALYKYPADEQPKAVLLVDGSFTIKAVSKRQFEITTATRRVRFHCASYRDMCEWMDALRDFYGAHPRVAAAMKAPLKSYSPFRVHSSAAWFVDGQAAFAAMAHALESAQREIFIAGWWLTPLVELVRSRVVEGAGDGPDASGPQASVSVRLQDILWRKLFDPTSKVHVYVMLYKEFSSALMVNDSANVKKQLMQLNAGQDHPRMHVIRHPDVGLFSGMKLYWSHHDKMVIVDQKIAFLGGLDMAYGRYDTASHPVADVSGGARRHKVGAVKHEGHTLPVGHGEHRRKLKGKLSGAFRGASAAVEDMWPGDDYYNPRIEAKHGAGGDIWSPIVSVADTAFEVGKTTGKGLTSAVGFVATALLGPEAAGTGVKRDGDADSVAGDSSSTRGRGSSEHMGAEALAADGASRPAPAARSDEIVEGKPVAGVGAGAGAGAPAAAPARRGRDYSLLDSNVPAAHALGAAPSTPGSVGMAPPPVPPPRSASLPTPPPRQGIPVAGAVEALPEGRVPSGNIVAGDGIVAGTALTPRGAPPVPPTRSIIPKEGDFGASSREGGGKRRGAGEGKSSGAGAGAGGEDSDDAPDTDNEAPPGAGNMSDTDDEEMMRDPVVAARHGRAATGGEEGKAGGGGGAAAEAVAPAPGAAAAAAATGAGAGAAAAAGAGAGSSGSDTDDDGGDTYGSRAAMRTGPAQPAAPTRRRIPDPGQHPRLPWHDVHLRVTAQAATDVAMHFIERWNHHRISRSANDQPVLRPSSDLVPWWAMEDDGDADNVYATRPEQVKLDEESRAKARYARDHMFRGDIEPGKAARTTLSTSEKLARQDWARDGINSAIATALQGDSLELNRCVVHICRSVSSWSAGVATERSIANAYVHYIRTAEHCIYIENQFFISGNGRVGATNSVAEVLTDRVSRAIATGQKFRVVVVLPVHPEGDPDSSSTIQGLMYYQYACIGRGGHSMLRTLRARHPGVDPFDYVSFYALRNRGTIGAADVTEQIYVHSKLMIVDDRVVIMGSANLNDRSLNGDRDSEIAAVVTDGGSVETVMDGKPFTAGAFAKSLRLRLMREHLGVLGNQSDEKRKALVKALDDPVSDGCYLGALMKTAITNTRWYERKFPEIAPLTDIAHTAPAFFFDDSDVARASEASGGRPAPGGVGGASPAASGSAAPAIKSETSARNLSLSLAASASVMRGSSRSDSVVSSSSAVRGVAAAAATPVPVAPLSDDEFGEVAEPQGHLVWFSFGFKRRHPKSLAPALGLGWAAAPLLQ